MLKNLFSPTKAKRPNLPNTDRPIYAIGDVHGRADLLEQLLDTIRQDIAALEPGAERPMIVFLGDYVDRGPGSRSVVDLILQLRQDPNLEVRALKGNHEQALLFFLADAQFGRTWMSHGGTTTLRCPITCGLLVRVPRTKLSRRRGSPFRTRLGKIAYRVFSRDLNSTCGKTITRLFMPGCGGAFRFISRMKSDLLWIRQEFLNSDQIMDQVVVHGHSPVEKPYLGISRIAVDTGAYATGILTAVRLWKSSQEILQTR